ncbi:MAG: toxin-antitoxin system YwqK family antitoxin [Planctomycetota bacterium]|jgi:hypothetical protein
MKSRRKVHLGLALFLGLFIIAIAYVGAVLQAPASVSKQYGNRMRCYALAGDFQELEYIAWTTDANELVYAICVGYVDYDPNMEKNIGLSYSYSYSTTEGGKLFVNGERIVCSDQKRLLANNPFGRWEEIVLDAEDQAIIASGAVDRIWREIVLQRLYQCEGDYVADAPSGHCTYRDRTGRLAYEGDYTDGLRQGTWVYYRTDGTVRAKINYKDGYPDGTWDYFENGVLADRVTWRNRAPVERPMTQSVFGMTQTIYPGGNRSGSSHR